MIPGYDPLTGLNTGNLGFSSPVGQNIYGDSNIAYQVPFQSGYLDVFKNYDPTKNPYAYRYDPTKLTPSSIAYDTGPGAYGGSVGPATQSFNGQTYNIGANNLPAGQSMPLNPGTTSYSLTGTGAYTPGAVSTDPTKSPTYIPWTAQTPSVAPSTQTYSPATAFLFGNNGSLGRIGGTFGNTGLGQSMPFYQTQPSTLTATTPGLGTFSPWNPALNALQQNRSQP